MLRLPVNRRSSRAASSVAIVALFAIVAACSGPAASPSNPPIGEQPPVASPSTPPVASPSTPPVVSPSAPNDDDPPVVEPSAPVEQPPGDTPSGPGDPDGFEALIDLETNGGGTPRALVRDLTESLAGAKTGHPAEGVSVGWDEVRVESIDDDSIRLTWSDYPIANEYPVVVSINENGLFRIDVVRPAPTTDTDTIALDRVLVLDFHVAVPLTDVFTTIGPELSSPLS